MKLSGHWFPPGASRRSRATLHLQGSAFTLTIADDSTAPAPPPLVGRVDDLDISARLGNIPRVITLADGAVFESEENEQIDRWLQRSAAPPSGLVHALESKWRWATAGLLVTVLFVFAGARWGLPWASERIAEQLPPPVVTAISGGALALMDEIFLDPSELPPPRQRELRRRFDALAAAAGESGNYSLHFRQLGAANAFALPAGEVVVTDKLVQLASAPGELEAVLLHEIGHIVHRHGLKSAVRASFLGLAFALIAGDPSGVNELVASLPVVLLQSHSSRGYEREADEYAFRHMLALGIDPSHFAAIMARIAADDGDDDDDGGDTPPDEPESESVLDYLSTHPPTPDRIARANAYSEKFKKLVEEN